MDTTIYVFSGTGTSLATAKGISENINHTKITSIPYLLANNKEKEIKIPSAKIGIIFPCYFGTVPELVIEFIRRANFENVEYSFSIVMCGGNPGISLKVLADELNNKGISLNYGKSMSLASNYIVAWYYQISCKEGKKLQNSLQEFKHDIVQIASEISNNKAYVEKSSYFLFKVFRLLSPKLVVEDTRPWDKEFSTDETCNGCGICSKICQVRNIKIVNKKPVFLHNCQRCMACIQYCPKHAFLFKNKEIKKSNYYHPDYPAIKMIAFIDGQSGSKP